MPTFRSGRPDRASSARKTEIKNMNSFRSVQRAIESEIERQIALLNVGRPHRAGDARLGRGQRRDALDAQQRRGARLPLLSRSRSGAVGARRASTSNGCAPRSRRCRGSASNATPREYGSSAKQATQLVDNFELGRYFDRVVALQRQPAAIEQLRARRSLAARQRDGRAGRAIRRFRPSIWPS